MKLVIAYSHVDALAALRLLCWVKYLGGVSVPLLVVASRRASRLPIHQKICAMVRENYPGAEVHIPADEDERGWPRSATHLFARSIQAAKDDVFWLEPDCVPIREGWFEALHAEFRKAGTPFVGRLVPKAPTHPDHMTGVAFYGKNWQKAAPNLCTILETGTGAWDVDRAPEILPHFTATRLIQHKWVRHLTNQRVPPESIAKETVVYHQCKTGQLMSELRPEFRTAALTARWLPVTTGNTMTKYYQTTNASRVVEAAGKQIRFEPTEFLPATNSTWGIYATSDEPEIIALDTLVSMGRIYEITEREYGLADLKKKSLNVKPSLIELKPWHGPQSGAPRPAAVPVAVAPEPEPLDEVLAPKPAARRSQK